MRIAKYFVVGGLAAAIDFAMFALLIKVVGLHWFVAAIISFVLATAVNYALSVRHVFQSGVRFGRNAEISYVFLVSGIGLAINQAALFVLIERLGLGPLVSKVMATGIAFFWNYAARQHFVFAERKGAQD